MGQLNWITKRFELYNRITKTTPLLVCLLLFHLHVILYTAHLVHGGSAFSEETACKAKAQGWDYKTAIYFLPLTLLIPIPPYDLRVLDK